MAERVYSCRDRLTGYASMYSVADLTRRILPFCCECQSVWLKDATRRQRGLQMDQRV